MHFTLKVRGHVMSLWVSTKVEEQMCVSHRFEKKEEKERPFWILGSKCLSCNLQLILEVLHQHQNFYFKSSLSVNGDGSIFLIKSVGHLSRNRLEHTNNSVSDIPWALSLCLCPTVQAGGCHQNQSLTWVTQHFQSTKRSILENLSCKLHLTAAATKALTSRC